MATYEQRRDKRFHETTRDVLNDIEQRLGTIEPSDDQVQSSLRYAAKMERRAQRTNRRG